MEIKIIPNRNPEVSTFVELKTPVKDICPYSHEPQQGSWIRVKYKANENLIEIHAIEEVLSEMSKGSDPLDLETVVQIIYQLYRTVFEGVSVDATYKLRSGVEITCRSQN